MAATKFAAFDLEIAKPIPDGADWRSHAPLGITCAAIAISDGQDCRIYQGVPQMNVEQAAELAEALGALVQGGYTIVTWNGTSFDFPILAEISGKQELCAHLALNSVDLMLLVTFVRGYFLSLHKALLGAGLEGKQTRVTLNDGTVLDHMSGAEAPKLWAAGEHDACISYLRRDALGLLALAEWVAKNRRIAWTTNSGKPASVTTPLIPVKDLFKLPQPDTSWMTNPPKRSSFVDWIPNWQQMVSAR